MISVIIPTYKEPEYLDLCLESLFRTQENVNQVIVVVDGHYDMNKEVLDEYEHLGILIIAFENNIGLSHAINQGVLHASNEDILIVNDDNVFPNKWDVKLMKAQDRVMSDCGGKYVISPNQIEPKPSIFDQFIIENFGEAPDVFDIGGFLEFSDNVSVSDIRQDGSTFPIFMKRKLFLSVGGFDTYYPSPHVVDWDFFVKCNLNDYIFIRDYSTNFYHFAGAATKKRPDEVEKFHKMEREGHFYSKNKWGSFISHDNETNLKSID